jgi:LmbE family N-acetylglucosaminyl deacetylase
MTNGDIDGSSQGYNRQGAAVSGQLILGMVENNLIFLGYPDGNLATVYNSYPNQNDIYITPWGQSMTYGNRGIGRTDYHSYRFGSPGNYNRYNMLRDLEDIISSFRPDHIFTVSDFDGHSDHVTTFRLVRSAIISVVTSNTGYTPSLHKAIVWWGGGENWPNPIDAKAYFAEIPDLFSETGLVWNERESIDVPIEMQSTEYPANPKYSAISAHDSPAGFLGRFIHKDEVFWPENFSSNHVPVANAGYGDTVEQGVQN